MNADPKGMARSLHDAADSIVCNTNAVREVPDALDAIRLVAVTLENVIEPSDDAEMLEWVCENLHERRKGLDGVVIRWSDADFDDRWTRGKDTRDAIRKAMAEDKAMAERAGAEAGNG